MAMTEQEAINVLCLYTGDELSPTVRNAHVMAMAALRKQQPKKPIKDRTQNIRYTSSYSCPYCGDGFTGTGIANYCYHCGQALDWDNLMLVDNNTEQGGIMPTT